MSKSNDPVVDWLKAQPTTAELGGRVSTAGYIKEGTKGTLYKDPHAACYASIWRPTDREYIKRIGVTYWFYPEAQEESLAFLEFMFSDKSPWRNITKHMEIIYKNDLPCGILCNDTNINSKQLVNCLIALRLPNEFMSYTCSWYYMVKHEVNPSLALLLSHKYDVSNGGVVDVWGGNSNHWAFNSPEHFKFNFKLLLEGVKLSREEPLDQGFNYYPGCCSIWNGSQRFFTYNRTTEVVSTRFGGTIDKGGAEDFLQQVKKWQEGIL